MQRAAAPPTCVRTSEDSDDVVLTGDEGLQRGQGYLGSSGEKHTHEVESTAPHRRMPGSPPVRRGKQTQGDELGPKASRTGEMVGAQAQPIGGSDVDLRVVDEQGAAGLKIVALEDQLEDGVVRLGQVYRTLP